MNIYCILLNVPLTKTKEYFSDETPCSLIENYCHSGRTCCLHTQQRTLLVFLLNLLCDNEEGESAFARSIGKLLSDVKASHLLYSNHRENVTSV
jgi:hypothetical protein